MKHVIISNDAPKAIGPYSHAYKAGNMIFTSGQLPIDATSGLVVEGGVEAQAAKALDNLKLVIVAAGGKLSDVVKTTVYIKNMNDFSAINAIYATYFTNNFPARTCIEIARLPKDALVEIEAIAVID